MKKKIFCRKSLIATAVACAIASLFSNVYAGGFQLCLEQNAVNLGDFGAGQAVLQDASSAYYNPAGLIDVTSQQVVAGADEVFIDTKFSGSNTWTSPGNPLVPPGFSFTQTASDVQGGGAAFVPDFHYALPLNCWSTLGFSVTAPFGLSTDYADSSILRYSATESYLQVVDLGPAVGFKLTPNWSIGVGLDAERLAASLNQVGGLPTDTANPTEFDSVSKNDGDAWGYGWHAGVLYQYCQTRIGLSYRSSVNFDVRGNSTLEGPLANLPTFAFTGVPTNGTLSSNGLRVDVQLPPTTTLSISQGITPELTGEASILYTQWAEFNRNLTLQNVQAITLDPITGIPIPALIDVNLPQHFSNTFRYALGGSYAFCPAFLLRAGVGYDPTPIGNAYRNVRLPDDNRYGVSLGAHYQVLQPLGVDVGWTHFFVPGDTHVSTPVVTGTQVSTSVGTFSSHVDVIGGQITWDI